MNPDPLWQDVSSAALLGTERRPFAPPAAAGAIGERLARLDASDRERSLLGTAAVLGACRRTGRRAKVDPSQMPGPCEVEDRPRCSPASAQHLATLLGGGDAEILPEWLDALAASGRRVPEEALPAL